MAPAQMYSLGQQHRNKPTTRINTGRWSSSVDNGKEMLELERSDELETYDEDWSAKKAISMALAQREGSPPWSGQ